MYVIIFPGQRHLPTLNAGKEKLMYHGDKNKTNKSHAIHVTIITMKSLLRGSLYNEVVLKRDGN